MIIFVNKIVLLKRIAKWCNCNCYFSKKCFDVLSDRGITKNYTYYVLQISKMVMKST